MFYYAKWLYLYSKHRVYVTDHREAIRSTHGVGCVTMVGRGVSSRGPVPCQPTHVCRDDFVVSRLLSIGGDAQQLSELDDTECSFDDHGGDTGAWNEMPVCIGEAFAGGTFNDHTEDPSPCPPSEQCMGAGNNPMLDMSGDEYDSVDEDVGIGSQDVGVDIDELCAYTTGYKGPPPCEENAIGRACMVCTKLFSSRSNMIRHIKAKHADKGSKLYMDWIAVKRVSQNRRRKERRADSNDLYADRERKRSRNVWRNVQRQKRGHLPAVNQVAVPELPSGTL